MANFPAVAARSNQQIGRFTADNEAKLVIGRVRRERSKRDGRASAEHERLHHR